MTIDQESVRSRPEIAPQSAPEISRAEGEANGAPALRKGLRVAGEMDGLSPELQLEERSPSDLLMYDPRAGSVELQGLQSGDQEAEVGHFPATQDVLDTSDWISTLTQSPFSPLPQVHHNQPFRGGVHDANSVPGAADDLAPAALARSPDQPLSYTGPNLDFSVPSTPACDDAPVSHPGGGNPAACRTSVLLFNELGSTYMCSISEGNGHITEYYRATFGGNRGPWEIVERSDAAKTAMHQEAGVPKSVPWPGPALIVFAQGKQEVGKGGILNQPTRKYYQWCKTCCSVTCASAIRGCTKAKCWIAPRKWKRHVTSQTHTVPPRPPNSAPWRSMRSFRFRTCTGSCGC